MNKITGQCKGAELDVKRFYVPGIVVESECPSCGSHKTNDLGEQYLSHPVVGEVEKVHFYCESEMEGSSKFCDTEWTVEVILELTVRLK